MLRINPLDLPTVSCVPGVSMAAGDPELPPLRSFVRLFDGEVYLVTEDEGGGEWSNRHLGPLSRDVLSELEREHHATILEWIADHEDAVRYGRECRREQEIYR